MTKLLIPLALAALCFVPVVQAEDRKPNVVLLMADDLNTALSGIGHPQCKPPRLDELATRGVRFENMHCQYPVCGASRASIMTGQYPYTNGTLNNTGVKRAENPALLTLPQLFRQVSTNIPTECWVTVGICGRIFQMWLPCLSSSGRMGIWLAA